MWFFLFLPQQNFFLNIFDLLFHDYDEEKDEKEEEEEEEEEKVEKDEEDAEKVQGTHKDGQQGMSSEL